MSSKGGEYERNIAMDLSRWWSGAPDTDRLCWRTSQSGGRATTRKKAGKKVRGHCGDLCAVDRDMEAFFKVVTLEVKRGYNKTTCTLSDILDKSASAGKQELESWIRQARRAAKLAGTSYWMIIHKRDGKRVPVVYMPMELPAGLFGDRWWMRFRHPHSRSSCQIEGKQRLIFCCTLAAFLEAFTRKDFETLVGKLK